MLQSISSLSKEKSVEIEKLRAEFDTLNRKLVEIATFVTNQMNHYPLTVTVNFGTDSDIHSVRELEDDRVHLLQEQRSLRVEAERDFQDTLIREREEQIQVIQGQMIEVNEIFRDLAKLVEDQVELVDHIETNITTSSVYVKEAKQDLEKAEKQTISSRNRLCVFAIVVAVLVVIVIVIVAVVARNKS
eukprot:TRINITY_DN391_c0_g1_i3.p1 TRINITY_DN391_c0_g1~~TRINITY_DN391_c0_g1_i3.p1  ORF type:complete len:188 (-),score=45.06 TRINITY_DN391_c0_g1_i3:277-840(-)